MAVDYEEGRRLLKEWRTHQEATNHSVPGRDDPDRWKAMDKAYEDLTLWMAVHAEALLNPDPWRPIEELPEEWKDGRKFLVWWMGEPTVAKWAHLYGSMELVGVNVIWVDGTYTVSSLKDGLGRGGPTHFRAIKGPGQ